jgi:glycosyltransferase involved in cell wall biosynthesis
MNSSDTAPVAVVIPTYRRGDAVLRTLRRVTACSPQPAEVWVHIDASDGRLELSLAREFPQVRILTSPVRLGPGGGRHRCLKACTTPYAVSFDDDSWPLDLDFFAVVVELLNEHPEAAIIAASIVDRHQAAPPRGKTLTPGISYVGCGHAIRLAAYGHTRGYLPRPVAYGMEETDIALQLFAGGWRIFASADLRVVHDTDGRHRDAPEIVAASLSNVALFAFLNYPVALWGWGVLQVLNYAAYCLRNGKSAGLIGGFLRIPGDCYRHRMHRRPLPFSTVVEFLRRRRQKLS